MTEEMKVEQAAPADETPVVETPTVEPAVAEAPAQAPAEAKPAPAPKRLRLDELKPGAVMPGTVKNIAQFGAFVDIGAEQDGLVHISELAENRVRRVEDVVKPGQDVEVTVLEVDTRRKRISLSMKPRYDVYDKAESGDFDNEPAMTSMQYAFQKAQEKRSSQAAEKKRQQARAQQDDILSRTLNQHRDRK